MDCEFKVSLCYLARPQEKRIRKIICSSQFTYWSVDLEICDKMKYLDHRKKIQGESFPVKDVYVSLWHSKDLISTRVFPLTPYRSISPRLLALGIFFFC